MCVCLPVFACMRFSVGKTLSAAWHSKEGGKKESFISFMRLAICFLLS